MDSLQVEQVHTIISLATLNVERNSNESANRGSVHNASNISLFTEKTEEERALYEAIESLDSEQVIELCALMWLGRDDVTVSSWEALVNDARYQNEIREYVASKSPLAEYLENGLKILTSGSVSP